MLFLCSILLLFLLPSLLLFYTTTKKTLVAHEVVALPTRIHPNLSFDKSFGIDITTGWGPHVGDGTGGWGIGTGMCVR